MSTYTALPTGVYLYSDHHGHERTTPPPYSPPTPGPPTYTTVDLTQFPNFYDTTYRPWNPTAGAATADPQIGNTPAYTRITYVGPEPPRLRLRLCRSPPRPRSQCQGHSNERVRPDAEQRSHHDRHPSAEASNATIHAADQQHRDYIVLANGNPQRSARAEPVQQNIRSGRWNTAPEILAPAVPPRGGSIVGTIRWRRVDEGEMVMSTHVRVRRPMSAGALFSSSDPSALLSPDNAIEEEQEMDAEEVYDEDAEMEDEDENDDHGLENDNTNHFSVQTYDVEPEEPISVHARSSSMDLFTYPPPPSDVPAMAQGQPAMEDARSISVFRRVRTRVQESVRRLRRGDESQGRRDWAAYNAYA